MLKKTSLNNIRYCLIHFTSYHMFTIFVGLLKKIIEKETLKLLNNEKFLN